MFTNEQQAILADKLDKADVKTRRGSEGKTVGYVEGWYVIDKANEVFGFGHWDAETVEMRREHEPIHVNPADPNSPAYEPDEKKRRAAFVVVTYSARVRVTVYSKDGARKIVRERCGGHRGFAATAGEAIENCIKSAETDATKRAFATFGNQFGLALYDKEHRNVGTPAARQQLAHSTERPMAAIDVDFSHAQSGRESGAESGATASNRTPESAPRTNSERALAVRSPPPNGRATNGGMPY